MRSRNFVGPIVLILLGAIALLQNFGWIDTYGWADPRWAPVWLVIVGVAIALRRLLAPRSNPPT